MWLHIINNEKFFKASVELFETALPGEHVYGVRPNPKYKMPSDCTAVGTVEDFIEVLESRGDWKGVVFNPLMSDCWTWLPLIPQNMKVIWYRWGAEAYSHWFPLAEYYRFMPKTKKWVNRDKSLFRRLREWQAMAGRMLFLKSHLKRVDFFVGPEKEEYLLLRKVGLLSSRTQYHFGTVGLAGDYFEAPLETLHARPDILLGNSAHPTNNHIEAIDWLASCDLDDRRIIAPLSYGDNEYRDMVYRYGQSKLGKHFAPILEFLPLDEYWLLLDSCGYVVMNHLRQQATGNIIIMLLKGAKVFLNNTSVYRNYKNWGTHIHLIQSMDSKELFSPLNSQQVEQNRHIIYDKLNNKRRIQETRRLLQQ